uniref:Putative secreted protein n=1 Tax=Ixodes ricinus TaxID=34613 RepID=A0A6B0UA07_IXORI
MLRRAKAAVWSGSLFGVAARHRLFRMSLPLEPSVCPRAHREPPFLFFGHGAVHLRAVWLSLPHSMFWTKNFLIQMTFSLERLKSLVYGVAETHLRDEEEPPYMPGYS